MAVSAAARSSASRAPTICLAPRQNSSSNQYMSQGSEPLTRARWLMCRYAILATRFGAVGVLREREVRRKRADGPRGDSEGLEKRQASDPTCPSPGPVSRALRRLHGRRAQCDVFGAQEHAKTLVRSVHAAVEEMERQVHVEVTLHNGFDNLGRKLRVARLTRDEPVSAERRRSPAVQRHGVGRRCDTRAHGVGVSAGSNAKDAKSGTSVDDLQICRSRARAPARDGGSEPRELPRADEVPKEPDDVPKERASEADDVPKERASKADDVPKERASEADDVPEGSGRQCDVLEREAGRDATDRRAPCRPRRVVLRARRQR